MNKYLTKIAEEKKPGLFLPASEAYIGQKFGGAASQRLLGYHTLYHGTNRENAKSIRVNGFDPAKGGSHNARLREEYVDNSKGYNHFTKHKSTANFYAGSPGKHMSDISEGSGVGKAIKGVLKDRILSGKILKTHVTHEDFKNRFELDRDSVPFFADDTLENRGIASKTNMHIPANKVSGGKGYRGAFAFMNREHLKSVYGSAEQRARAAKGLLPGVVAAGLLVDAARRVKNRFEHK